MNNILYTIIKDKYRSERICLERNGKTQGQESWKERNYRMKEILEKVLELSASQI